MQVLVVLCPRVYIMVDFGCVEYGTVEQFDNAG